MDRWCVFFLDYLPSTPSFSWLSRGYLRPHPADHTSPLQALLSPLWVANCVGWWLGAEAPSPGCMPWLYFP